MENSSGSGASKYSDCVDCAINNQQSKMTTSVDFPKKNKKDCKTVSADDSDEINKQNICNKQHEKLNKPCQNGFCYCFTSDSDQHIRKRKPKVKSRKYITDCKSQNHNTKHSEENTTETSDYSERIIQKYINRNNNLAIKKVSTQQICETRKEIQTQNINKRNYMLTAKTSLDKNRNAPLIHIIQEIHEDCIISEVKINEPKLVKKRNSSKKNKTIIANNNNRVTNDTTTAEEIEYFTEKTLKQINCESETTEISNSVETSSQKTHITSSSSQGSIHSVVAKKKSKNLKRENNVQNQRLSDNNYTSSRSDTPPKKPPRTFSKSKIKDYDIDPRIIEKITSIRDAEKVLDKFLEKHGYTFEKEKLTRGRQSFPIEKRIFEKDLKINRASFQPSCPTFDEIESDKAYEPNIEWVSQKVNKMLNYSDSESGEKNFITTNPTPRPQMGWVIPPKQNIDDVDGPTPVKRTPKPRELDNFHNFAKNMESKSTPMKSNEFIENSKLKIKDSNLYDLNETELDNNQEKLKSEKSSSSILKTKESANVFFKNSKQKIIKFVSKIGSKDKIQSTNKAVMINASCQTSVLNLNLNDTTFGEVSNETFNNNVKKARFHFQSPPGSYFSSSPKIRNDSTEFDFNRKVNSPLDKDQLSPRRLSFSPKKIIRNFSYRSSNNHENGKNSDYYKSYQSDFNGDFSLNIMNDILLSIKSQLEASDRHAEAVFDAAEKNDEMRAEINQNRSICQQQYNQNNNIQQQEPEVHQIRSISQQKFNHNSNIYPQEREINQIRSTSQQKFNRNSNIHQQEPKINQIRSISQQKFNHNSNTYQQELHQQHQRRNTSAEDELSEIESPETEVISANADIHYHPTQNNREIQTESEQTYSEIEEEEMHFNGSPSIRSLNGLNEEITHFYVNDDPKSEYAKVNKKNKQANRKSYVDSEYSPDKCQCKCNKNKNELKKVTIEDEPNYAEVKNLQNESSNNDVDETDHSYQSVTKISMGNFNKNSGGLSVKISTNQKDFESLRRQVLTQIVNKANSRMMNEDLAQKNSPDKESETEKEEDAFDEDVVGYRNQMIQTENVYSIDKDVNVDHIEHLDENDNDMDGSKTVKELVDYFETTSLCPNNTCNQDHSVSYESPNESENDISRTFQELKGLNFDTSGIFNSIPSDTEGRSKSCPIPQKYQNLNRKSSIENQSFTFSSNDDYEKRKNKKSVRYQLLKHQFLRKSFKKGKSFFKRNIKNQTLNNTFSSNSSYDPWDQSNLGLHGLFDTSSWEKQLERAVFLCRKLPILENSNEAVEAERLLLYSRLKSESFNENFFGKKLVIKKPENETSVEIKGFEVPINSDFQFSEFFNFFYIGVFTDGQKNYIYELC